MSCHLLQTAVRSEVWFYHLSNHPIRTHSFIFITLAVGSFMPPSFLCLLACALSGKPTISMAEISTKKRNSQIVMIWGTIIFRSGNRLTPDFECNSPLQLYRFCSRHHIPKNWNCSSCVRMLLNVHVQVRNRRSFIRRFSLPLPIFAHTQSDHSGTQLVYCIHTRCDFRCF